MAKRLIIKRNAKEKSPKSFPVRFEKGDKFTMGYNVNLKFNKKKSHRLIDIEHRFIFEEEEE